MNNELLERETPIQRMVHAVQTRPTHGGLCMLVSGEAGVGKTTLVQHFIDRLDPRPPLLWGACEALNTPRPLGPLMDMAAGLPVSLTEALRTGADQGGVFDALLSHLNNSPVPFLVWIEDLHWADHATLDLLRFLGRRLARCRAILLLTYRDDEVGPLHPLRNAMADLQGAHTLRLPLAPLSRDAVAVLARNSSLAAKDLFDKTGGNPFFVAEVLAAPSHSVPPTVQDAVLARQHSLGVEGRSVCETLSVWPGQIDMHLVQTWLGPRCPDLSALLDDCVQRGVLELHHNALRFRHELARLAICESLPVLHRRALHAQALELLGHSATPNPAQLVEHALGAALFDQVLLLAPRAAAEAARLGAHREAAAQYALALAHCATAPLRTQAELHETWSYEAGLALIIDASVLASREQAVRLWHALAEPEREGLNLRWLSRLHWYLGQREASQRYLNQAIDVLESARPGSELAMAYSMRSQFYMLNSDHGPAMDWAHRAIDLALAHGATEARIHALNNLGCSMLVSDMKGGEALLIESLELALAGGFHEQAARAYTNLSASLIQLSRYSEAETFCRDGLAFDQRNDLDAWTYYLMGLYAQLCAERGAFEQAQALAKEALAVPHQTAVMRWPPSLALGMALSRSGAPGAIEALQHCLSIAQEVGEPQLIIPTCRALAEALWQSGQSEAARDMVCMAWAQRGQASDHWLIGQIAVWGHRLGIELDDVPALAPPYRLEREGRTLEAAKLWEQAGAPFEQALCLLHGAADGMPQAIELLLGIQAPAALALARDRARQLGLKGIKRGPYSAARQESHGLTAREHQVFAMMRDGLSNEEISQRLKRSVRTVEHHASAVLAKLGMSKRSELRPPLV